MSSPDLHQAGLDYKAAREAFDAARDKLARLVRAASKAGMTPTQIAQQTGWSRAQINIVIR
jgi:hypothetical protein